MGCGASTMYVAGNGSFAGDNAPTNENTFLSSSHFFKRKMRGNASGGRVTGNNLKSVRHDDSEELSDITAPPSARNSAVDTTPSGHALFRSDDLGRQRLEVPLSIEEDFFVYDDAVVSKNEAQTKHWRIEGRKPQAATLRRPSSDIVTGVKGRTLFHFTDFNVCVDEMDVTVNQETGTGEEHRLSIRHSALQQLLIGATVTRTFSTLPNTVAAMERSGGGAMRKKSSRKLRDFNVGTLIGHSARVKCIAVSSNELSFVSCSSEEASVTMRNLVTGQEEGIFTGHHDTVICTALSPDGKYLATTSKDHTMTLWDATITKLLYVLQHDKVVICCCFSPDSKTVISGCQDRICRVWDIRQAKERLVFSQHAGIIVSVAYSPDGAYVCSASADRTLRVWSATTGKTHLTLQGHVGIVLACSYTSDGKHIISNDESILCVWSTANGTCKLRLTVADVANKMRSTYRVAKLGWTVSCAAPGPFTDYIAVACTNRFVYILKLKDGEECTSTFCKAPVYCMSSGSSSKLLFGDSFGNIYTQTLL
ncbi:protein kinase [Trypanosoma grayi]|uniref:protein kinase n=1 Tax=Trypanosoma grayi TaxID=71804 RepID=UPI0004F49FE2|nr:protein kinase [Trypanosoma grayi]KEG13853.1 protein kinase [Trypanosoma grayi]